MSIWTAEEMDYQEDILNIPKLNNDELYFIRQILAFFNQSDGMINDNLAQRFYQDVPDQLHEARAFYTAQLFIETVHSETYGNLLEVYVPEEKERHKYFNAIENFSAINKKAQWFNKWITSNDSFANRLIAFAIIEGVFFSGSFCAIYWLKDRKKGMFPGLAMANQFISRDEGLHCEFAAELFRTMGLKVSQDEFYKILSESISIEKEFIIQSLPVDLIGMNSKLMIQYIECVGDSICDLFGYERLFNKENPFPFMTLLSAPNQTNFFESRVSEYSKVQDTKMEETEDF